MTEFSLDVEQWELIDGKPTQTWYESLYVDATTFMCAVRLTSNQIDMDIGPEGDVFIYANFTQTQFATLKERCLI